jgi:hypothetical protein
MEQVTRSGFQRCKHQTGGLPGNPAILLGLIVGLGLILPFCSQAADAPLAYKVQAAFLLNFTKFIEWPASAFAAADSPVAICILGDDPFGSALDQIVEGEVANGRKISIQRINRAPTPQSCQVVFVGKPDKEALKILPALGLGVLTVSEGSSFVRGGGMIAFVLENRRVRFDINLTVAENAGLKLSSKLLSVARVVEK